MNNRYRFKPLDVAAYIKWAHLAGSQEREVLARLWRLAPQWLDLAATTSRYDRFEQRVFEQLYYLYTRGYVDETSDPALIRDPSDREPGLMTPSCFVMESYLKRLCLHFLLTPKLPYLRIDMRRLATQLGFRRVTKTLLRQSLTAIRRLGLLLVRENGVPADHAAMQTERGFLIGLSAASAAELATHSDEGAYVGDWSAEDWVFTSPPQTAEHEHSDDGIRQR